MRPLCHAMLMSFCAGAVAIISSTADAPAEAKKAPQIRIRKNITSLNANSPEIIAFEKAISAMKMLSTTKPADGRGWAAQARVHGTFTDGFLDCKHSSWEFWPWHRAYLFYFEEICRELSGDETFALPYWDWSSEPKIPDLCWGNALDNLPRPQQAGSGRGAKKNQAFTADEIKEFVGKAVIDKLLNSPDFDSVGGTQTKSGGIEGTPHNYVHCWVDGDMCSGGSAWDPIFWLHHCNVDRLWSEWSRKHGANTPNNPGWLDTKYSFTTRGGKKDDVTVRKTLNTADLFYTYDTYDPSGGVVNISPGPSKLTMVAAVASKNRSPLDSMAMDLAWPWI
jgi:tyrosinase